MNISLKRVKSWLLLAYVFLYIINAFYPWQGWQILMVLDVIMVFILAYSHLKMTSKILSIVLLALGIYFLAIKQAGFSEWVNASIDNAGLICLLVTIHQIKIILSYDNFQDHILAITEKKINSSHSFHNCTLLTVNILGILLNVASVPLVYHLLEKTSRNYPRGTFYKALTRGVSTNLLWSPNFASVGIVLHYIKLPYYKFAPFGLLFSLLGTFLAFIMGLLNREKNILVAEKAKAESQEISAEDKKNILKVVGLVIFLLTFIIALEKITHKSVLVSVPLVAFSAPLILAFISRKLDIYRREFTVYFNYTLPSMYNEFFLFTSIGFLAGGL